MSGSADTQGPEHAREAEQAAAPPAVPQETDAQGVKLPAHGQRGTAAGARGCWALNKRGEPCAAPAVKDGDYCSAHSGLGISQDPTAWSKIGGQASHRRSQERAALRLALGLDRSIGPRAALRVLTAQKAAEISGRAVDAVLDPKVKPDVAARLALDLINAVDPVTTLTVEAGLPSSPEGLEGVAFSRLLAMAEGHGLSGLPVVDG